MADLWLAVALVCVTICDMAPSDPIRAATALSRLQAVHTTFRDVGEQRRVAIIDAVRAEVPLRQVAAAAGCSHESVRRIVAANGAVTLELDPGTYALTRQQVELMIYKLAGAARGAFPRDIELLGAGDGWLPAAAELASALQAAMPDDEGVPIALNEATAFALYQILRLTETGRPTTLSRLYDILSEIYARTASDPRSQTRQKPTTHGED